MTSKNFQSSSQASSYIKGRLPPPTEAIQSIIEYLKEKSPANETGKWTQAVDVGCGSGQCSAKLVDYFEVIYGFDSSEAQLKHAAEYNSYPNVKYQVGQAESLPIADNSTDLITASYCLHWFDKDKFFTEAKRILTPNGVFARIGGKLGSVKIQTIDGTDLDPELEDFIFNMSTLMKANNFVNPEILKIQTEQVNYPFEDVQHKTFVQETVTTADTVLHFVQSLSSFQNCKAKDPQMAEGLIQKFTGLIEKSFGETNLAKVNVKTVLDVTLTMCRNT